MGLREKRDDEISILQLHHPLFQINLPEQLLLCLQVCRFGFIPSEKVESTQEISPGYINLTELKMQVFEAFEEEKRTRHNCN